MNGGTSIPASLEACLEWIEDVSEFTGEDSVVGDDVSEDDDDDDENDGDIEGETLEETVLELRTMFGLLLTRPLLLLIWMASFLQFWTVTWPKSMLWLINGDRLEVSVTPELTEIESDAIVLFRGEL